MTDNDTSIIEVDRLDQDFTILSRHMLQDPVITADAQMVGTFLLSLPQFKKNGTAWEIHPRHVWKAKNIGRDRVYKAINELCDLGYMKKEVEIRANLKGKTTYFISTLKKFLRHPGSQEPEAQEPEAQEPKSQDYNKNPLEIVPKEQTTPPPKQAPISPPKQEPIASPTSKVVCSLKDDILKKTKLTELQRKKVVKDYNHIDLKTFSEAVEVFIDYTEKNQVRSYMATLISALGGGESKTIWKKSETQDDKTIKNKNKVIEVLGKYDNRTIGNVVAWTVNVLNTSVEFSYASACKAFKYSAKDFTQQINAFMDKSSINIKI